jgi:cobalt/nickel transport system permease protein
MVKVSRFQSELFRQKPELRLKEKASGYDQEDAWISPFAWVKNFSTFIPSGLSWKGLISRGILILTIFLVFSGQARAMHISEGLLPFHWALFWFMAALPFWIFGLVRLKKSAALDFSLKPLMGFLTAVVFIISCMPVPVPTAGTCSHPCGTAISGILLGPSLSILITSAALLIQALFLAHGGLTTWGADIFSMGVVGSWVGFLVFRALRIGKTPLFAAGFFAGLLADWTTYLTTSIQLASGIKGDSPFFPIFWKIVIAFIPTQLPLGLLEGAMTAGMIVLLYKKRPDLLVKMKVLKPAEAGL